MAKNMCWPRAEEEMSDNGNHKLVFRPLGMKELYHLENDPRQLNNVWNHAKYGSVRGKDHSQK